MKLRKLDIKDAPLMLEWMHDDSVVCNLSTDFGKMTIEDCNTFITKSLVDSENLHMAIVDECDEYMGTVSLKHIDKSFLSAEFAITVRKKAMGKQFSRYAMSEMIKIGFEELGLNKIYWCVSKHNQRAVHFYDKNGYKKINIDVLETSILKQSYDSNQIQSYIWYLETKRN